MVADQFNYQSINCGKYDVVIYDPNPAFFRSGYKVLQPCKTKSDAQLIIEKLHCVLTEKRKLKEQIHAVKKVRIESESFVEDMKHELFDKYFEVRISDLLGKNILQN
jgi:hypothetical protein